MFSLFNKDEREKEKLILRESLLRANRLFERAMSVEGINSDKARYWSDQADRLEAELKKYE